MLLHNVTSTSLNPAEASGKQRAFVHVNRFTISYGEKKKIPHSILVKHKDSEFD